VLAKCTYPNIKHELAHWAFDNLGPKDLPPGELGFMVEKSIYGGAIYLGENQRSGGQLRIQFVYPRGDVDFERSIPFKAPQK